MDLTLRCSECGGKLPPTKMTGDRREVILEVGMCVKCGDETFQTGFDDGFDRGVSQAETDMTNNMKEVYK